MPNKSDDSKATWEAYMRPKRKFAWYSVWKLLVKLTRGRRRRKKDKIRIYDEYQKPNFPREVQASKLDESSATKLP